MKHYSRRQFLGTTALGTAALLAAPAVRGMTVRRNIPVGVQLYSVREAFNADVPGTLAGIRQIGYEGVEFAGYAAYKDKPTELKKILDDNLLTACGSHLPGGLDDVTGDNLAKTIEFNQIIGNNKLIVASLHNVSTEADWERSADAFSSVAEKLKPHKMRIGYHNHVAEFVRDAAGRFPEDVFFDKASPDVFIQLDIGHCAHAGADHPGDAAHPPVDPAAFIRQHNGRILSVHMKDWNPATHGDILGEGIVHWPEVLAACELDNGPQWLIVEEESGQYPQLGGIAKDFVSLIKMQADQGGRP